MYVNTEMQIGIFYRNTIKLISFVMLQEQIGFQFYLLSIKYFYNNTLKSD